MRVPYVFLVLLLASTSARAQTQEQIIYPAKGQSAQQQDKDKYECYGWAKGQTGFDPMALPVTTTPAPQGGNKSVAGGAIGGAAAGAAIGAVGGVIGGGKKGAGKGAGMGAGMGGLMGGMSTAGQNQKASQDRQQWEQREAANYANRRNTYNRAFAACLEGRGYTVR